VELVRFTYHTKGEAMARKKRKYRDDSGTLRCMKCGRLVRQTGSCRFCLRMKKRARKVARMEKKKKTEAQKRASLSAQFTAARRNHLDRHVAAYLKNTRAFRAGDPSAVPPWDFPKYQGLR
jgi:hypothetical protein